MNLRDRIPLRDEDRPEYQDELEESDASGCIPVLILTLSITVIAYICLH